MRESSVHYYRSAEIQRGSPMIDFQWLIGGFVYNNDKKGHMRKLPQKKRLGHGNCMGLEPLPWVWPSFLVRNGMESCIDERDT